MNEISAPPYILMVEDSETDALLFQEACKEVGGLNVAREASATAVLRHLSAPGIRQPELILVDSKLPDMDGIAFARRLLTEHGWDRRRIVMLCGIPRAAGELCWGLWLEKPDGWEGWRQVVRTIARHADDVNASAHV